MSPVLQSQAHGNAWVWICTGCAPSSWSGRILGVASISQPGHEYSVSLRPFSWKGVVPSADLYYGMDLDWMFTKGFLK